MRPVLFYNLHIPRNPHPRLQLMLLRRRQHRRLRSPLVVLWDAELDRRRCVLEEQKKKKFFLNKTSVPRWSI